MVRGGGVDARRCLCGCRAAFHFGKMCLAVLWCWRASCIRANSLFSLCPAALRAQTTPPPPTPNQDCRQVCQASIMRYLASLGRAHLPHVSACRRQPEHCARFNWVIILHFAPYLWSSRMRTVNILSLWECVLCRSVCVAFMRRSQPQPSLFCETENIG